MAFTVVSLTEVRKSVTKHLNAAPDDNSWSYDTSDQGKFNPEFIRHQVRIHDAQVCYAIIDTIGQTFRPQFISATEPVDIADGGKIPAHAGQDSKVEIKTVDATPDIWVIGTRAKNLEQILRWQEFPAIYGNGYGKYYIQDVFIKFCGLAARVWVPDFQIDTTTGGEGACQAPDVYTATVEKGAMAGCAMAGGDMQMHAFYAQAFQVDLAAIMRKEMVVPPIEAFRRAGG